MNHKQYMGLIILVLVIFGVLFFWFALRPSFIRQNCYSEAKNGAYFDEGKYNNCLIKNGL